MRVAWRGHRSSVQKPKRLFRFYGCEKVQQIVDFQLILSSPEYFNDPFDCTPSYEEMFGESLRVAERDLFYFSHPKQGPDWKTFIKLKPSLLDEVREIFPDKLKA